VLGPEVFREILVSSRARAPTRLEKIKLG